MTIGPWVGMGEPAWVDPEPCVEMDLRDLNAAIDCDTPSASMNCSRSSMLVRPLAEFRHTNTRSFFSKVTEAAELEKGGGGAGGRVVVVFS